MKNNLNPYGLFILLMILFLAGCSSHENEEGDTPIETNKQERVSYKVAVIMPLSQEGNAQRWKGIADWVEENMLSELYSAERVPVLDIEWYDEDTEEMSGLATRLCNRDDIWAIVGPESSVNAAKVAQQCVITRKPLILPHATSAELVRFYAEEEFIWSISETDISQCETLLAIALEEDAQKVSLIAADDIYGQTFTDWFAFQARELNLQVGCSYSYVPGNPSSAMRQALRQAGDVLICVPASTDDARVMLEVAHEMDESERPRLLFSDMVYDPDTPKLLGELAENIEGTGLTANPESGFSIAHRTRFGYEPINEAGFYDALLLTTLGLYDIMLHGGTDLNQSLNRLTAPRANQEYQQGAWLPGLLWIILFGIEMESYIPPSGASAWLVFDEKVRTNVLSSTYAHWLCYRGNFLTMDYHTTDGSRRTDGNLAGWNRRKEQQQEFDTEAPLAPTYPELQEQWAVIIAASKGWSNYRHQSDALAFYQLLKRQGYTDDHIVLIAEDDLANAPNNFAPGTVINQPDGDDVRQGAVIDYPLTALNPADLTAILCGEKSNRLPEVIHATANDNVLLFWSGHGSAGEIRWGDDESLTYDEALKLTATLKKRHPFRKMLWLMETCYAGSVTKACEGVPGLLAITASNEWETSKADVAYADVWLSNRFTRTLIESCTSNPSITMRELYYTLFNATVGSHVTLYNEAYYGSVYEACMDEYFPNPLKP